jgi:hypothetical protein
MDFMVFSPYTTEGPGDYHKDALEGAHIVPAIKSATWVERYRDAGEFTIVGSLSTEAEGYYSIRDVLPIGSMVSHIDSNEIMIVENHEIDENRDNNDIEITITGRSFETYLENRVVGQDRYRVNKAGGINANYPGMDGFNASGGVPSVYNYHSTYPKDYNPPEPRSRFSADRALCLIEQAITNNNASLAPAAYFDVNYDNWDKLAWVHPLNLHNPYSWQPVIPWDHPNYAHGGTIYSVDTGDVYSALLGILDEDGLGIKSHRPGLSSPLHIMYPQGSTAQCKLALVIYHGQDRTKKVMFSYSGGDVEEAQYLESNKLHKNSVLIRSNLWEYMVRDGYNGVGYGQRAMFLDASDIDQGMDKPTPPFTPPASVHNMLIARAWQAVRAQKNQRMSLISAKLMSQQFTQFGNIVFRRDYDTGDLVTVVSNHGEKRTMMVSEHVEIEDENGELSQPILVEPTWEAEYVP